MALVLDGLGATPWVLALLYLFAMVFISKYGGPLRGLVPCLHMFDKLVVSNRPNVQPAYALIVCVCVSCVSVMKLKYLHNMSPEMDTTKMFVVSVLLSCVMRCLSFIAIGSLSLQSIKFDIDQNGASGRAPSGVSPDPDTDFYEKVRSRSTYVCWLCCTMCTLLYVCKARV